MNRNWWQKVAYQIYHVAFRIVIMTELVIYKALFKNGLLRKFRNYADLAESNVPVANG